MCTFDESGNRVAECAKHAYVRTAYEQFDELGGHREELEERYMLDVLLAAFEEGIDCRAIAHTLALRSVCLKRAVSLKFFSRALEEAEQDENGNINVDAVFQKCRADKKARQAAYFQDAQEELARLGTMDFCVESGLQRIPTLLLMFQLVRRGFSYDIDPITTARCIDEETRRAAEDRDHFGSFNIDWANVRKH